MKIKMTNEPVCLDLKRCRLPIEITDTCPRCSSEVTRYLSGDYLSHPRVNAPIAVSMYHYIQAEGRPDEEHEWEVKIVLRVTAEAAP